jgi:hypothetical protein
MSLSGFSLLLLVQAEGLSVLGLHCGLIMVTMVLSLLVFIICMAST